jgi:hypothetical protein
MRLWLTLFLLLPSLSHAATVGDLFTRLEGTVAAVADSPATRADFEAFARARKLAPDDALYDRYVRVKIAFEATRAGGLWGTRWQVTDQEPQSDRIWAAWATLEDVAKASAVAECDELSALFAFVARGLGVRDVGLFWPTWNHTVAVWTIDGAEGPVRVVVPTSQIFLDPDQSLGTDGFDPWTQKTIYTYTRKDVALSAELDEALIHAFVSRVKTYAPASSDALQTLRNLREIRQSGLASDAKVRLYLRERQPPWVFAEDVAAVAAFEAELQ